LRWLIQRGISVIPKSVRRERIVENADIWNFELTKENMDAITTLDANKSAFFNHRDPKIIAEWVARKFSL
jgi:diketogulonate reductase-like aldo/keto reductase